MAHSADLNAMKQMAAEAAVELIRDGMTIGLGTGSTAYYAVEAIARRVQAGLRVTGVATSEKTAAQARERGIALVELNGATRIDLTIDGADEIETGTLNLIKGRGGALLREKIVATASPQLVIVADESKLVERLGRGVIPVEVVPFGWEATAGRIAKLGMQPSLRMADDQKPFLTDGGHHILDCRLTGNAVATSLAEELDHVTGVVEHGFFLGMASQVFVGTAQGLRVLTSS